MKTWHNVLAQLVGVGLQFANASGDLPVPDWARILIAAGVGGGQAYIGWWAHKVNPDGTPAKQPYVKP